MRSYTDEFLSSQITATREARAESDVSALGMFPSDWHDRLVELRTYIVTCQECAQGGEDDLFLTKLRVYRDEFASALEAAMEAARKANLAPLTTLTIKCGRG